MSWQDYVDKQLLASRCVTKAAIAGHDGNLWAKSEGFEVSNLIAISNEKSAIACAERSTLNFTYTHIYIYTYPYIHNSQSIKPGIAIGRRQHERLEN